MSSKQCVAYFLFPGRSRLSIAHYDDSVPKHITMGRASCIIDLCTYVEWRLFYYRFGARGKRCAGSRHYHSISHPCTQQLGLEKYKKGKVTRKSSSFYGDGTPQAPWHRRARGATCKTLPLAHLLNGGGLDTLLLSIVVQAPINQPTPGPNPSPQRYPQHRQGQRCGTIQQRTSPMQTAGDMHQQRALYLLQLLQ